MKSDGSTAFEGAEVMLHTSNWSYSQWTTSDSSGAFSFTSLDAGTYIMEFRTPWNNSDSLVEPDPVSSTVTDGATFYRNGVNGTNCSGVPCPVIQFAAANNTITGTLTKSNSTPISGAYVEAYKEMGNGWVRATTNASGVYTIRVGSGTWMVSPRANYGGDPSAVDWTYTKMPTRTNFTSNTSPGTTSTINFTAQTANCQVSGTVKDPNGNALVSPGSFASASVWSREGGGQNAPLSPDDTFTLKVPEGSYQLEIFTWGSDYGSPASVKFTVKDANSDGTCDGYAAGTLRLAARNATISGRIVDTNGAAVANTSVSAWKQNSSGWANATTNASGNYSMAVTAGTWMVSVMVDPGMYGSGYGSGTTYINDSGPLQVTVADSATRSSNNFTLKIANATISGRVVDSDSNTLTSLEMGYAYVETGSSNSGPGPMMYSSMGAPVKDGIFTLKVPAGTYNVGVATPPGAGYCTGSATSVTAVAEATSSASITLTAATATISGSLKKDSDSGTTITGVRAEVFANSGTMNYSTATIDSSTGAYSMTVCPGDWYIGYWIDPSLTDGDSNNYLRQPPTNNKVTVAANQSVTKNVIVKKADATISGTVTDPDGAVMSGVWVSVDTRSNETAGSFSRESMFYNGTMSASDGTYSIKVPSGTTYYVEAFLPPSYSYINPNRVSVTPASGATGTVNLQFKNADATMTGTVTQSGAGKSAFVSGWSEDGGYAGTTADSSGTYSLSVTSGVNWHIKAMYESGTSFTRSSESIVNPSTGTNTLNLDLSNSGSMPESTTVTYTATNQKTITLSDGTTINIPAGALASSGNVTVTVTGKAQLPTQSLATPVNIGYTIQALDGNGSEITSTFNSNVTIVMPYSESTLTTLGITEDELLAGYWDTTTNSWRTADNTSIDKDNNTITVTINHFTDFAPFTAGKRGSSSSSSSSTSSTAASLSGSGTFAIGQGKGKTLGYQDGKVVFVIPEDVMPYDTNIQTVYAEGYVNPKPPRWLVGKPVDIVMKTDQTSIIYSKLRGDGLILVLRYTPGELRNIDQDSLRLVRYNATTHTWKELPGIHQKARRELAAVVRELGGTYGIIGGGSTTARSEQSVSVLDGESPPQGEPTIAPAPTIETPTPTVVKPSFFSRIVTFFRSLFSR